jgi:hypothetical protein
MEVELFGQKLRIEILLLILAIGYVAGAHLLCSCSRLSFREGLSMLNSAEITYKMGQGVNTSWESSGPSINSPNDLYKKLEGNQAKNPVEYVESGGMSILNDNVFDPKCCPSQFSNSSGCACLSPEQVKYISERGGNRTYSTEY